MKFLVSSPLIINLLLVVVCLGKRVNSNSFSDDISREKFHEGFLASTFGSSLPDEDPVASNGEIS